MSEKHESETEPRLAYAQGVISELLWLIENHMKGSRKHDARVLLDNLQATISGVAEVENQVTLRKLAEVTADRDELCLAVPDWHTLNRLAVALQAERDALKRRVEELEREVRSLKTYDHFADL